MVQKKNDTVIHVKGENRKLLDIKNGDLADVTTYTENYRATYHGK